MNWMPHSRATARVPATVVAPSARRGAWRRGRAGPPCARPDREPLQVAALEADAQLAVEQRDRRRDGTGRAHRLLARQRGLDAGGCGKPCATSVVSSATTGRPRTSASSTSRAMRTNGAGWRVTRVAGGRDHG